MDVVQIKCIYIALHTSADISKCCTETQPKTLNSKHMLECLRLLPPACHLCWHLFPLLEWSVEYLVSIQIIFAVTKWHHSALWTKTTTFKVSWEILFSYYPQGHGMCLIIWCVEKVLRYEWRGGHRDRGKKENKPNQTAGYCSEDGPIIEHSCCSCCA